MRPRLALPVLAALALSASAAMAQPIPARPAEAPAPALTGPGGKPISTIEEGKQAAAEMSALLASLDARISTDEIRMTQLRDPELAAENTRIRAIRPALSFHGKPAA